jgi:uncharacterized protein YabE (DUF348 family)
MRLEHLHLLRQIRVEAPLQNLVAFIKKNKKAAVSAAGLLMLVIGCSVYLLGLVDVTVVADGVVTEVRYWGGSVPKALAAAGVTLAPFDETIPAADSDSNANIKLRDGSVLQVLRAVEMTIAADGTTQTIQTVPGTARTILAEAGITIGEYDRVFPDNDQPVPAGTPIRVVRVEIKEVTAQVAVSPPVEERPDPELERGKVQVLEPGKAGVKEQTVRQVFEDGKLKTKEVIAERIMEQPRQRVVKIGTKPPVYTLTTSRGTFRYSQVATMSASAYCPCKICCGPKANGITKSGKKAGYGVVAVDPKVIPLGTQFYIEGYGPAVAADIGSAIKGNRIDLCFETHQEALNFGRRKIQVYILVVN